MQLDHSVCVCVSKGGKCSLQKRSPGTDFRRHERGGGAHQSNAPFGARQPH